MRLTLLALALATPLSVAPAIAQQSGHGSGDGSGHGSGDHGTMDHDAMKGVHAEATVNAIDGDSVNVSHGPIAEIGWPAMTMDLAILEGAEIGDVAAGDKAMMMLEKGPDGLYGIRALMPAE